MQARPSPSSHRVRGRLCRVILQGVLVFAVLLAGMLVLAFALRRRGVPPERATAWAVAFMLVGCAGLSALIGRWTYHDLQVLEARGVTTNAQVDDYSTGKGAHVDVTFTTRSGERVQASTSNFSVEDIRASRIEVVYDPEKPTRMQAAGYGFDPFLPYLLWGLSGVLLVVAAVTAVAAHRTGRSRPKEVRDPSPW